MLHDEDKFPPLTMLPMLAYAIAGALDASKEQLTNLLQAEKKPYVLDDETINRVIGSYTEQNKTLVNEKAMCAHWRRQNLNAEQIKTLDEIATNLIEMEKINQQIVFLAQHYKEHTIDKILEMGEAELALAYLTGKLYPFSASTNPPSEVASHKSFTLPPDVTCQRKKVENNDVSYTFRHAQWGEIGRIDVIPQGRNKSQINAYVAAGDPRDPMTELRTALFHTIAIEFSDKLEKKHGAGISAVPLDSKANKQLIESKAIVCLTCDTPVALLIFAHDVHTPNELEDYARMMYATTVEMNLPTWIIGAEKEVVFGKEGVALILKTWPERRKAEKISSLVFEPMLYKLQSGHCA